VAAIGDGADDPDALAGSELAWRRRLRGGTPRLDLPAAARIVRLLPELARDRVIAAAHDVSVGGLGVALARMAIAAGSGADIALNVEWPTAALFGERPGRVVLALDPAGAPQLRRALATAACPGRRIGMAGGSRLIIAAARGTVVADVTALDQAWRTVF